MTSALELLLIFSILGVIGDWRLGTGHWRLGRWRDRLMEMERWGEKK